MVFCLGDQVQQALSFPVGIDQDVIQAVTNGAFDVLVELVDLTVYVFLPFVEAIKWGM